MAPGLLEQYSNVTPGDSNGHKDNTIKLTLLYKNPFEQGAASTNYEVELNGNDGYAPAKYPHYLPYWDDAKHEPYTSFEATERGKGADPAFPDLLSADATVEDIGANIGAEVKGIQLSKLNDAGKDQLALFVAQKKVVAFRDQDFADLPIQEVIDLAEYFGPSHIHPTSGAPKGYPKVHLVHRSAADTTAKDFFTTRTNSTTWHSDVSYEQQPPGTTFLYILDGPTSGGDTVFANQVEAYARFSSAFQQRLHGLTCLHSGHEQAESAIQRGSIVRRQPVANVHPLVRTHPATGERALYVNSQFTRSIVGLKMEESDHLLKFLFDHIAQSHDLQCRVKWSPGTVIVWDNRSTAHSAILDWQDGQRRHLARLTPRAEEPYETPFEK